MIRFVPINALGLLQSLKNSFSSQECWCPHGVGEVNPWLKIVAANKNTEYDLPCSTLLPCLLGPGHVVHPVHRVRAARDPS